MNPPLLIRCPVRSCRAARDEACIPIYTDSFADPGFVHNERGTRFSVIEEERGRCGLCSTRPVTARRCRNGHVHLCCGPCALAAGFKSRTTIERCLEDDADKSMVMLAREIP